MGVHKFINMWAHLKKISPSLTTSLIEMSLQMHDDSDTAMGG
jgi:hypothetical protein